MSKLRNASLLAPTPDNYVSHAIKTIGYAKHTSGYWPHALMQLALTTIHAHLPDLSNSITMNLMQKIKNKALKLNKKHEEKKKTEEKSQ